MDKTIHFSYSVTQVQMSQSTNYATTDTWILCSLSANNIMNIWLTNNIIMWKLQTDGTNLQ